MAEKILEVKDLRISFRTTNGKVQAVRDISFDLYKGETFAIVGESGSGKSVTSRAIMGILAGNAIKEGGKILFDGKDLMKISEEEFQDIRGDKIAMIFQDPLSSLNPIMRVGQQLTEAMLLKNKAARRESKKNLKNMFNALETRMKEVGITDTQHDLEIFKKFGLRHAELQHEYTDSLEAAREALALAENMKLRIDSKAVDASMPADLAEFVHAATRSKTYFVVREKADVVDKAIAEAQEARKGSKKKTAEDYSMLNFALEDAIPALREATEYPVPNTFVLAYYLENVKNEIPDMPVEEMNDFTHKAIETGFMDAFEAKAEKAVKYSSEQTDLHRQAAIKLLTSKLPLFEKEEPVKSEVDAAVREMKAAVAKCLDPLEVTKDSLTHTFPTSIDYAVDLYFNGGKRNEKEEKRFNRSTAKHDRIIARGKTPDWEVIPASYVNLEAAKQDMADTVKEQIAHMQAQIEANKTADFALRTGEIIDYLKAQTQDSAYRLTKAAARERAIKLMENVGIDNPRRRFRQYPFEFSGGMRQRIVIAIALTANPDILICDEPTTALDVTIQAQILELINNLKEQRNLSVIFITHDLGVVANMADRIGVMYAGKIVEYGTAHDIFYQPAHPYTWALLSSVPDLDTKEKLESIPGTPPNMIYPPKGDAFADRNANALEIDFEMQPPMFQISDTHYAATWLLHPNAPKIEMPPIIQERLARIQARNEAKKLNGGESNV